MEKKRLIRDLLAALRAFPNVVTSVGTDARSSILVDGEDDPVGTDLILSSLDLRVRLIASPLGWEDRSATEIEKAVLAVLARRPDTWAAIWVESMDACRVFRPDCSPSAWMSQSLDLGEPGPVSFSDAMRIAFGDLRPAWPTVKPASWKPVDSAWLEDCVSTAFTALQKSRPQIPELREAVTGVQDDSHRAWVTRTVQSILSADGKDPIAMLKGKAGEVP